MELDYYRQKVNILVFSFFAGQPKFWYLGELGNFMRILQIFVTDGELLSRSPQEHNLTAVLTNCEKSAVKHSIDKPMIFNFFDLSSILFQGCLRKNVSTSDFLDVF